MRKTKEKLIAGRNSILFFIILFLFLINLCLVYASADFQVTSFSCSPEEIVVSSSFSCTAQIKNSGDNGSLGVVTLYPDSSAWLEESNYPQAYGSSIQGGETISIAFSELRATKSGTNGFSKIMLDSVTDNYVSDNGISVNTINVIAVLEVSDSSVSIGDIFDVIVEITAGGSIDVVLKFEGNAGCDLGSQSSQKTITGMTDGSKQSRTWTAVTQADDVACSFTITATATGTGGIASKQDSSSETLTCSDCPVEEDEGGGGGGSGGGVASANETDATNQTNQNPELNNNTNILNNQSTTNKTGENKEGKGNNLTWLWWAICVAVVAVFTVLAVVLTRKEKDPYHKNYKYKRPNKY